MKPYLTTHHPRALSPVECYGRGTESIASYCPTGLGLLETSRAVWEFLWKEERGPNRDALSTFLFLTEGIASLLLILGIGVPEECVWKKCAEYTSLKTSESNRAHDLL